MAQTGRTGQKQGSGWLNRTGEDTVPILNIEGRVWCSVTRRKRRPQSESEVWAEGAVAFGGQYRAAWRIRRLAAWIGGGLLVAVKVLWRVLGSP